MTATHGAEVDRLLTRKEAAARLRVSLRHLETRTDIRPVNVAPPASRRPMWRYWQSIVDRVAGREPDPRGDGGRA